jgi:hypothetical protein
MSVGIYSVQITDTAAFDVGAFSIFILFLVGVAVLASKLEDPSQKRLLNIENLLKTQSVENQDILKVMNHIEQSNQKIIKLISN